MVLFGGYDRGVQKMLDLSIIYFKEIEVTGSYWVCVPLYSNLDLYGVTMKLIKGKTVPVS